MVQPPVDFDTFVRTELRHDPDVIVVGEVRDSETVKACMHLSDTGHLVYATLHTNDIPTTFSRLEKMDVDLNQLSYSLRGILVQKLVRKLCPECKGAKCTICNDTGYLGQTLLVEFAEVTSSEHFFEIKNGKKQIFTFLEDAGIKAREGTTDCKELSRVLGHSVEYCNGSTCVRGGAKCM
jgi:general secretion pathway protein E